MITDGCVLRSRYARRSSYYASSVPPERERERERPSFSQQQQQRDARSVRDPRENTRQDSVYSDRDRDRQRTRGDSFSSSTKDYRESSPPPPPPVSARWKQQPFRKAPNTPERPFERDRQRPAADDLGRRASNGGSARPRSLSPVMHPAYSNGRNGRLSEYPSGSISARDGERYALDRERERERERGLRERDREDRFQRDNNNNWNSDRRRPSYPPPSPARYYEDHPASASSNSSNSNAATALPPPPPPANTVIGKRTREMEERDQRDQQQQARRQPPPSSYVSNQNRPNNMQFEYGRRRDSVSRGGEGSESHSAR